MNKEIAQKALDTALKNGAQKAKISLSQETQNTISILDNSLDRILSSESYSLSIQLFVDGKFGSFSTNRMNDNDIASFIKQSIESTKLLTEDLDRTLPSDKMYYNGEGYDLKQYDSEYTKLDLSEKMNFILDIASQIDHNDKRVISSAQDFEDYLSEDYIIDSNGFCGESLQSFYSSSCECTVRGKGEIRPQNYWSDSSMFFDSLKKECGKKAFERALRMIDAKKINSGKYNVILENTISNSLISPILNALNGASIQQQFSFLSDSLDKHIFSDKFTMIDTPHLTGEIGARWFDGEGLATKDAHIIDKGVIRRYFLSTYYANKLKMTPTIDSISVASLTPTGPKDPESMMKQMNEGVFITGLNGGNCNGATGDFSFGIEGFYFKNGSILHPVKEMNMTGNIISLWNQIAFIGEDPRECVRLKIPTISFFNVDLNGI